VSPEPYIVRKLGRREVIGLLVLPAWLGILHLLDLDVPRGFLVAVVVYILALTVLNLERLRVDEKGLRVRPAGRIPWNQIERVTYRGPNAVAVKLKPGSPLPRGVRGMVDGEVTLPARGIELDQARLDDAVRAYSDAGGSFSGSPGSGASSSGMSAGGPSG
jgi:hypothetical protein